MTDLRVLGPLELIGEHGQPVALTARKHRQLLAALTLAAGEVRSWDALIASVWQDTPPTSAHKLLQVYVSQLRRVLPPGVRILTSDRGYALDTDAGILDAHRLEQLLGDARRAFDAANPALAGSLADRALALWRGPAYAELDGDPAAQPEIARLEALRLAALELRMEAQLAQGRHAEVLGELRQLIAAHPLLERFRALAMLALYRCGRQADALELYAATYRLLDEELGVQPGVELADLQRRILVQDASLDPVAAPGQAAAGLPVPPNRLVGRGRELAQIAEILARGDVRLLVLTGAGGCGKTRLALEAARRNAGRYANGAAFVELAPLQDPALVVPTIARAFGVKETSDDDLLTALLQALGARELLLVVDNAEHLRPAAPAYADLLRQAPRLTVLVTSRAVLHLSGEHVFPVAPLAEDDAICLFEERAQALLPSFAVDSETAADVREICRRVDGLPLAIELAAARIRTLSPKALLQRLEARLTLLTGGPRDLPQRQQTLRETIAWSVNLLDDDQRRALARLTVLPGGASAESAWHVGGADLDTLAALTDDHLLQRADRHGDPRFQMLETVREYADELLGADREEAARRRAAFFCDLAESVVLSGPRQQEGLPRLDAEVDNLRVAWDHAVASGDVETELRLAAALWRYWWIRGHLAEGWARLAAAVTRVEGTPVPLQGGVLNGAAGLAWSVGAYDRATALAGRLLAIAEATGADNREFQARNLLGLVALREGRLAEATVHLEQSLDAAQRLGDAISVVTAQLNLGVTAMTAGDLDRASPLFLEVLAHHRSEGILEGIGFAQLNLGEIAYRQDDAPRARECFEEARTVFGEIGFRAQVGYALLGLAACSALDGDHLGAARLLGRAQRHLDGVGAAAGDFNADILAVTEATTRDALGDEAYADALAEGRSHPEA